MYKLPKQLYENWNAKNALEKYLPRDINRIIFEYTYESINLIEYDLDKKEPTTYVSRFTGEMSFYFYTRIPIIQIERNLYNEKYFKKFINQVNEIIKKKYNGIVNYEDIKCQFSIYNHFKHFGKYISNNEDIINNKRIERDESHPKMDIDLDNPNVWTDESMIHFLLYDQDFVTDISIEKNSFYCYKDIPNY